MISTHQASLNQLWAELIAEQLVRHGIRDLCLAPGSRSTPLVMAVDRRPELRLHHHFDERGLGFLALGLAKASGNSVAIITTSGTAVANLYPAVIEAAQTGERLLVITADRPPRLHDCGANQAINQQQIFAEYPRHSLYLPPPSTNYPAAELIQQLDQAIETISDSHGGVSHINCMFDEPLYPGNEQLDCSDYLQPLSHWLNQTQAPEQASPPSPPLPEPHLWQQFGSQPGLVIAGALDTEDAAQAKQLAQTLGWPLLADIQSQLIGDSEVLSLTDQLLCQPDSLARLRQPMHLLQLGGRLVSKRLQAFIEQQPWQQYWLVNAGPVALAPGRNQQRFFNAKVSDWQPTALQAEQATEPQLFEQQSVLEQQLAALFASPDQSMSEPTLVHRLLHSPTSAHWLLTGNSLSIRLLDLLAGPSAQRLRLYANRGASGIEGLVSTALGISLAESQPGTLLLGDYSLLFDLNALALLADHQQPLVVIVLNNDGGGIFRMLPVADESLRQRHYQRPHGLHFDQACAMFGLNYQRPTSLACFEQHYRQALQQPQATLIEIVADAQETEHQLQALIAVAQTDTNKEQ